MATTTDMSTYVIAVKRAKRAEHTMQDAMDVISNVPDVEQLNTGDTGVLLINVPTETLLADLKQSLGDWCHIEPRIDHSPQVLDGPDCGYSNFTSDPI